ncbi:invasion associated locus B family protein [Bradyrhizobium sp. HKCCYLS1011]|uniref:invasion associated locus B family protein n=1 Tax=Bradyrhizobium sp. HKCCYLS1011 TaxID=3420733 RepID=UPI003EC0C989
MTNLTPQSPPRSGALVPFLLSLLMLLALWATALAQSSSADKDAKPSASDSEPRGQRSTIRDIRYGEWRKVCFQPSDAKMVCRTTLGGTWQTGQSAVRADLIEREGEPTARLQLFLPVGLYLPAGVKLSIAHQSDYRIPFVWCLTNLCIAGKPADPTLLRAMENGQTLTLEVVDSNLLTVSTDMPLAQFAGVRHSAPSRIYEQDIEE